MIQKRTFSIFSRFFIGITLLSLGSYCSAAALQNNIIIQGVTPKIRLNIEHRLLEISRTHPLITETDDALKEQVKQAMYPYGFFNPHIVIREKSATRLSLMIQRGSPMLITDIRLSLKGEGKEDADLLAAMANFPIKPFTTLNSIKYDKAKQAWLDLAERAGYLAALFDKAEIAIDSARNTCTIILELNSGYRYFFGQARFDPGYISPELFHRYIPFHQGAPYSNDEVMAFNNALTRSGYFKSVTIESTYLKNHEIDLNVHTQPVSRTHYSLGLGYGTDTQIRARASLHVVPVNRAGHKFDAVAQASANESALQAQYIIPGKNPLVDQYEITARAASLNYDVGYANSALISLGQRHTTDRFQRILSLNGLYERFNYTSQPKSENFSLYPKLALNWVSARDQLFSPTGYKIAVNGLVANKALLSDTTISQVLLDARAAVTFKASHTRFYFHGMAGATAINDIYHLPLSLALLLGGSDNLKGYNFYSLGPGKQLTYGGIEIQQETKKNWYVLGFYDSGDVFSPNPRDVKQDVGVGLMWVSPVGPIKIAVAKPINVDPHQHNNTGAKLVISMGPDL